MSSLPSGTVTFLFTDIEGSTKRWEAYPRAMGAALAQHDEILRGAIEAQGGGYVFKTVGDAFCAAFGTPHDALSAALGAQRALYDEGWPAEVGQVRVRMALHTGVAEQRGGDYFGQPVNRVARLLSVGHGGQVLISQPTYELVRDALPLGAMLSDLGEHRLKDLARPEHIYQLSSVGRIEEFPPLKTLDNRPNNLPLQLTPFIGREQEVEETVEVVRRPQTRMLTLTGPGGTGKTRLALQVGAEMLEEFQDGIWFVELGAVTEDGLVVSAVARALSVSEARNQSLLDTLKDYLREKEMLLLLDNFEQVIGAAPLIAELLKAAKRLKILVTSRVALRVYGEREHPVTPLALPPDRNHLPSLDKLTQYEAVRLFIERAQATKPEFEVNNENAPAVAEICYRLDGLPLAIELAAARIRMLTPQAMLSRIQSRLKLLTGGARDLPLRQQTLYAAIEWSYDLLEVGEKQLLRRLAVFQGGRTLEALEAVCNYDGSLQMDVLDGVESLISKSLLQQREGKEGEPRFWMLETIHEYTREKLAESGEEGVLEREHAYYFLRLVEEAEPELLGANAAQWMDRLEEEHDNLRAVLRWALEQEDGGPVAAAEGVELGLKLAWSSRVLWTVGGYYNEGGAHLRQLLAAGTRLNCSKEHRAKGYTLAAHLIVSQADYEAARALNEQAMALARETGNIEVLVLSLHRLGHIEYMQDNYSAARALFEEGLALAKEIGNKRLICMLVFFLANATEDLLAQRALYEQNLPLARELGNKGTIANHLSGLAFADYMQGNYTAARPLLEESLRLYRENRSRYGVMTSLGGLGHLAHGEGDYLQALSIYHQVLVHALELGTKQAAATNIGAIGATAVALGQLQTGARLLGATQALLKVLGAALEPEDRVPYEQGLASARKGMGEEEFERAMEEGRAMSMDEAVELALSVSAE